MEYNFIKLGVLWSKTLLNLYYTVINNTVDYNIIIPYRVLFNATVEYTIIILYIIEYNIIIMYNIILQ